MFTGRKHDDERWISYLDSFAAPSGYLDFASWGPPSSAALRASSDVGDEAARADLVTWAEESDRARRAVAGITGFGSADVALVSSTSLGLFQVAFALRGAEVLVSRGEFPANLYPWWRAEEAGVLNVRTLEGTFASVTPARVADALRPSTAAVAVSAVDFRTGWRVDLAGMREVIGDRLLIVDGIQGVGVVDAPWSLADVLVVGGQKWLRAGWGTGFVALTSRARARMTPLLSGWAGVVEPSHYDGHPHPSMDDATQLALTNGDPAAARSLAAAIDLVQEVGVPALAARIASRASALDRALRVRRVEVVSPGDAEDRAGIVVARWQDESAPRRADALRAAGVRVTLHGPDRIRLSVHATTTEEALERAAEVISR